MHKLGLPTAPCAFELILIRLNRSVNYPIEACMFSLLFARGGNPSNQ
jgi:hypothetical protein